MQRDVARGERLSFQAVIQVPEGLQPQQVAVVVKPMDGFGMRVRRVGLVPLPHHNTGTDAAELDGRGRIPGLIPDPLLDERMGIVGSGETISFWISVKVHSECRPGAHPLVVEVVSPEAAVTRMRVTVRVYDLVVGKRRDFPVTHWIYADALLD